MFVHMFESQKVFHLFHGEYADEVKIHDSVAQLAGKASMRDRCAFIESFATLIDSPASSLGTPDMFREDDIEQVGRASIYWIFGGWRASARVRIAESVLGNEKRDV